MSAAPARDPRARAAIRAFVRECHPDVGGDEQTFVDGLARLREGADQGDGPVTFVAAPRGWAKLLYRIKRWRRRKRRSRVR